jgi:hypothetical protein
MKNPTQTPCGTCYEKESIKQYLSKGGDKDPVTFKPISPTSDLIQNKALKAHIDDFTKKNPWTFEFFDSSSEGYQDLEFKI